MLEAITNFISTTIENDKKVVHFLRAKVHEVLQDDRGKLVILMSIQSTISMVFLATGFGVWYFYFGGEAYCNEMLGISTPGPSDAAVGDAKPQRSEHDQITAADLERVLWSDRLNSEQRVQAVVYLRQLRARPGAGDAVESVQTKPQRRGRDQLSAADLVRAIKSGRLNDQQREQATAYLLQMVDTNGQMLETAPQSTEDEPDATSMGSVAGGGLAVSHAVGGWLRRGLLSLRSHSKSGSRFSKRLGAALDDAHVKRV